MIPHIFKVELGSFIMMRLLTNLSLYALKINIVLFRIVAVKNHILNRYGFLSIFYIYELENGNRIDAVNLILPKLLIELIILC